MMAQQRLSRSDDVPGQSHVGMTDPVVETRAKGERCDGAETSGVSRRAVLGGGIGTSTTLLAQQEDGDEEPDEAENGEDGETVTVELVDFAYEPGTDSPLVIPPGTTVEFVWITDTHNIAVDSQPDEADWEGHDPIEDTGFEYEFTFEVPGTYEFHCDPHLSVGMVGTIQVEEGATTNGDNGTALPVIPGDAITLAVATIAALVVVTFMAYFFIKYGTEYEEEP